MAAKTSDKPNVLVLNSDSFRWDNLTVHEGSDIHTPNLDRLAGMSVIFENAYAGSYPTLPNRTDAFLGTWTFPNMGWVPLDRNAPTLAQTLSAGGVNTALAIDCPHMVQQGKWFERGFDSWYWVRGHENDPLAPMSLVKQMKVPGDEMKYRQPVLALQRHMANQIYRNRQRDEDYLMAELSRVAVDTLRQLKNGGPWFMWVDMFDPHEPHDPPQHYFDMYYPGYKGVTYQVPVYDRCDCYSKDELKAIRAAYLGEVTMVDHWLGFVMENVRLLGLDDNTIIIFTSDHGLAYGDHGYTGKNRSPLFGNIARIPLLVSTPEMRKAGKSRIVSDLVQPVDFMPTVLEAMGVKPMPGWKGEGKSLMPFLNGKSVKTREAAFTGSHPAEPNPNTPGGHLRISTREWSLIFPPNLYGKRAKPMLFNMKNDIEEKKDVIKGNLKVARELYAQYCEFYKTFNKNGDPIPAPSPETLL